jgi:hypothetical protein
MEEEGPKDIRILWVGLYPPIFAGYTKRRRGGGEGGLICKI